MEENLRSIEDREKFIIFINENDDFWKMVDYINWYNLTDFGRNDNHHEYMSNTKIKLKKFIEIKVRKQKINKIKRCIQNNNLNFDKNELIKEYHSIYQVLLRSTYDIFKDEFISGKLNVSDDGYWDLRSSLIGYGKDFLLKSLGNKQMVIDISVNRNFRENFGYIFQNE